MNLSSSFKVQSRDDYGKSHNLKESTLSPGHYNLNFSQIEKNIPRHKIGKSLSHVFQFPRDLNKSDLLLRSESHEKRKRIPGISFEKQSNRVLHIKDTTVPNENRFTVLNLLPRVSSKYKNNSVPDLSKYLPRSSDLFKVPEYSPCYSPNKEFVLPKLVPTFKFKPITRKRKLRSSNVSPISFSHGAENLDEVLKTYSDSPTCKTRAQHTYSLNSSWLPCNKGFLENKSFKSTNDSVELSGNFYL
ncbi:unnamed protein product [Blepharisma stoltei]|uniref:Uncharacterized protein n=1 Tax=Blepharisma stoltei TaxID=1481888 RepID=A0AAU9JHY1_9CILI|nr:unnamed protein product [Blepharisma stoltei]